MIIDLNIDEIKQLEYELRYREGELMGGGDTEQASKLAGITDKIFNAKNKVYVVIEDWASDDDNGASVVGVYTTEEQALEKMNKVIEELKENGCLFETIVKGGWHFDSYTDGEWAKEHECLYIEPVILDEDVK